MERKKYTSPAAMRIALEERINRTARESNQDIARLRRQVAFDRLLARIFSGPHSNRMVLKGGYAIELRLHKARTTKDIDLCIDGRKIARPMEKTYPLCRLPEIMVMFP